MLQAMAIVCRVGITSSGRSGYSRPALRLTALGLAACAGRYEGESEAVPRREQPVAMAAATADAVPTAEVVAPGGGGADEAMSGEARGIEDSPAQMVAPVEERPPVRMRTIGDAVDLINSLPKPTTLAAFIAALPRPLGIYATASPFSAQPSVDPSNPRTFLVFDQLAMSIVPTSNLLEFGFRTGPGRSIKAEIEFPVRTRVTQETVFEQILVGQSQTSCNPCHGPERRIADAFFTEGAWESSALPPFIGYEVAPEALRSEATSCDARTEAQRCAILQAIFDGGPVEPRILPDLVRADTD